MKLKKGLSIFIISLLLFSFTSCNVKDGCEKVNFSIDEFVTELINNAKMDEGRVILLDDFMNINNLYETDIKKLNNDGFTKLECENFKAKKFNSISSKEMNPDIFNKYSIIELSKPLYNSSNNTIAITSTVYCGNDCGSVDIYHLKEDQKKWRISEVQNLSQM